MISSFLVLVCAVASGAVLTVYQNWIDDYTLSLEALDANDTTQADKKFWGEFNVIVQGILLSIVNTLFELIFENLTEYESWDLKPSYHLQLVTRLTNLEFFVTALIAPVVLTLTNDTKYLFGIIDGDLTSNKEGEYTDVWYTQHGMGMFI